MTSPVKEASAAAPKLDGRTTRWHGHRNARRAEFVAAAIRVIEREGPSARVSQFTAEVGTGRSALYRQFTDRADLDRAICDEATDRLVDHVTQHMRLGDDLDASIAEAIDAYVGYIAAHPLLYRFVQRQSAAAAVRATGETPAQHVRSSVSARVASIARDYVTADSEPVQQAARIFATGVVGLVDAVTAQWIEDPGNLSQAMLTRCLVLMIRGAGLTLADELDAKG